MKKLLTTLATLALPVLVSAQGWPANYGGVMMQGFSWDNFVESQWNYLEAQADEMSQYFDLIWVPQSGNCNSGWNVMGYMPVYWFDHNSSFGSEAELRSMIKAFKDRGTGIIADVVINHRNGLGVDGSWVDFPAETYKGKTYQLKSTDVCANDDGGKTKTWATKEGISLSSNNDTGEDWDGSRDLDHKSSNVQENVKAYLKFLLDDLGYAGFRYDMVRGFSASFINTYNSYANPTYSVGENWTSSDAIKSWIDATSKKSAAFDFQFRYTVRNAINDNNWTKLAQANGTGTGNWPLISQNFNSGSYRRYAVTFVENHDMQDRGTTENYTPDPIKKDTLAANAYMLAMPGTPCVFMPHWKAYKKEIKSMIDARKTAGIHNMSATSTFRSNTAYYAQQTTGTKGKILVVVGNTNSLSVSASQWIEVLSGYHYKYYMEPKIETAWADVASGQYFDPFKVKLVAVSATSGAKLVYTTNGTNPTASSTQVASGTQIDIKNSCTLKVGLLKNGAVSSIITRNYVIKPFEAHTATVYLKQPGWDHVYFYAWDKSGQPLGNWPGTEQTATKSFKGNRFYYHTFDINSADYYFNIIFNQGQGLKQTVDIGPITQDVFYEIAGETNGKFTIKNITSEYQGVPEDQGLIGDCNGDGVVDVKDVTALISYILGTTPAGFVIENANVNQDPSGNIDVQDVTALINLILK
ncbi:MAG: starch-binding protein [Muribaculaceae bacterium]|nr:starch-binding protein [Muribaculaceae bacterium]